MARLYLDSDVSVRLAPLLQAAGHDAVTAANQGRRRATDEEQLLAAAQQGRILVTHNRKDFVLLHAAWQRWPTAWGVSAPAHAGILVLDQAREPELTVALATLLAVTPPVPLSNALYWWRFLGGWHQQLPDHRWVRYP